MRSLVPVALLAALATLPAPLRAADTAPADAVEAPAPTVTVAAAEMSEVQARVPLSGTLVPRREVQIYPQVAGYVIEALSAEAGDRVTKGQALARLSDTTLRAQLAQAQAEWQRADATVRQAESQITSAKAQLAQAGAAEDRAQALRRSGNASQAALDQAVAAGTAARAAVASANDGLAVARAALAQAEAAREVAQLNVDRTVIAAPVNGVVTRRNAELGALSNAAGEPIFTIIEDGAVEMLGQVIESALLSLHPGDAAVLDVAGVGEVQGSVRLLPAQVDATTRLGDVRIALPADERLRPGLFAAGTVITDKRQAVTVPSDAVLSDAQGDRVQVVKDDRVDTRVVRAGLLWEGRREIVEGVAAGEQVIARAGAFFRSGDAVTPVTAEEAAALAAKQTADQPTPAQQSAPATGSGG